MTEEQTNYWTEEDSALYRELAAVAVPAREEQLASLIALMPFGQQDSFQVVELGCGEGILSAAILDAFPNATVLALDGSVSMREHTSSRLKRFGRRAEVGLFDLTSTDWHHLTEGVDCVVSSLAVHHLAGEGKRRMFEAVCRNISNHGALLIADLVEPRRPEAWHLFADAYDRIAKAQSLSRPGPIDLFKKLVEEEWNYYRFPDPEEQPSPLFDQLTWLKEAGFAVVDCFWLQAGHAIYGGYRADTADPSRSVSFEAALRSVQAASSAD